MNNATIESIQHRIASAAFWRRSIATKFPDDKRNARAADCLDELATADPDSVTSETTKALEAHARNKWLAQATSDVAKDIEFRRRTKTLDEFLQVLVENLTTHTRH